MNVFEFGVEEKKGKRVRGGSRLKQLLFLFGCFSLIAQARFVPEVKEWTILVYLAGDDITIEKATRKMIEEIHATPSLKTDGDVRVVLQFDAANNDPNYRYLLGRGNPAGASATPAPLTEDEVREQVKAYSPDSDFHYGERDSGNVLTLKDFLRWGIRTYPARHYALVMSGHSWGQQGMMQDFFVDGKEISPSTIIPNYEMRRAMQEIYREEAAGIPGGKFDLLLIDACTSGQFDVLVDFQDVFKYFAGTSLETPYNGLPYSEFLEPFIKNLNFRSLTARASDLHLERDFLKPMVNRYLVNHVRGGRLVEYEGQTDTVQAFALRMEKLPEVGEALKQLVESIPEESRKEWRDHKILPLERIKDSDSNADLFALAKAFHKHFSEKGKENASFEWQKAAETAQNFGRVLGTPAKDPTQQKTVVDFSKIDKATGVWLKIQTDETMKNPDQAICFTLKYFATLNPDYAKLLPEFTSKKEKLKALDIRCNDLAEEAEEKTHPRRDQAKAVKSIFKVKVNWPHGVPAYVKEEVDQDHPERLLSRNVYLWVPKQEESLLLQLRLFATEKADMEFVAVPEGATPGDYFKGSNSSWLVNRIEKQFPAFVFVNDFPEDGLYVAEGHTNATQFKQGMGIFLGQSLEDIDATYTLGRVPLEQIETAPFAMNLETYFQDLKEKGKLNEFPIKGVDYCRLSRIDSTLWLKFLFE